MINVTKSKMKLLKMNFTQCTMHEVLPTQTIKLDCFCKKSSGDFVLSVNETLISLDINYSCHALHEERVAGIKRERSPEVRQRTLQITHGQVYLCTHCVCSPVLWH